ncbi:MAG: glycosyltransferase family 2 protein [Syntrophales bacterium]|nr:glycosyltransferase family 2 protein [Syntrophales bacterium]MDD5531169.1 glycosyltransferase family 2 protein [Syntrophales bacterium]
MTFPNPMTAEIIFWLSLAFLFYTYAGYAGAVFVFSKIAGRDVRRGYIYPSVSVVIAVHNEEQYIERKIESILEMNYPRDRLDLIIVSDGSTDNTLSLLESTARKLENIHVLHFPERRGKAAALNYGIARSRSEIIFLTDARQTLAPDCARELVSNFNDPSVGAASGALVLTGRKEKGGYSYASYWSVEKWIRKSESRIHSVIGLTGAVSAIRRELYEDLPEGTLLDDVMTPMRIALKGRRIVFDERAVAYDDADIKSPKELKRKIRTLTGNFQLLRAMPELMSPLKNPLFIQFFSHKVTRLLAPLFILALFLSNLLAWGGIYSWLMIGQAGFYLAALYGLNPDRRRFSTLLSFPAAFLIMNYVVVKAFLNSVSGRETVWARE